MYERIRKRSDCWYYTRAKKKPTNLVFQKCLESICDDLLKLKSEQFFDVNDIDQQAIAHFYII